MLWISGQLLGFLLGTAASVACFFLLLQVKPRIAISSQIAHSPQNDTLKFRISNQSRNRQITDIEIRVIVFERRLMEDGIGNLMFRRYAPEINTSVIRGMSGYSKKNRAWELQNGHRIVISNARKVIDLLSEEDKDVRLVVTLSAVDGLSQTKIVKRETYSLTDVLEGDFTSQGMEIKPV